ncbi:MAG: efflux RND transporter permease subunit [Holophagales bacterium]|nr:efflux RND transporter permease subunit [Holophagales bacterium]
MTRFFLRRPVTTWMLFLAFVVLAVYAIPRLEIEALPDVELPSITVTTRWQGASPKAVQRSLTRPIEEAVQNLHGIESLESRSRAGVSHVVIELRREVELDFARLELGEQLASVRRNLPVGATPPEIVASVPEELEVDEFFTFSVESSLDVNALREVAEDWVAPRVLAVEGVADVQVRGGARPLIEVRLDRRLLELYRIHADEVFVALDRLGDISGAGAVRSQGRQRLVALRQPVELETLEKAVVAERGGRVFRLHMLGEVRSSFEDPSYFVRSNGRNVVQVQVEKRSGANSVAVSRSLRRALPDIAADTPGDVELRVDQDEGGELENKLRELVIRSGTILALLFLVLAVTLREWRLTAIVLVSILFSLVICLSLFFFLGLSVNFITISGLTICFGMLLDNGILVIDSIHRRLGGLEAAARARLGRRDRQRVAHESIVAGTREVLFPILATTLTTMVAFGSFVFLSGRLALYYTPLAIAVGSAMLASVFVAFGWIPVVLDQLWVPRIWRRKGGKGEADASESHEGDETGDSARWSSFVEELPDLDSRPGPLRRVFALGQRLWFLILPLAGWAMVWGLEVYEGDVVKGGFWQMPDPERLTFYLRMADGTDVRVLSDIVLGFEERLAPLHEGVEMRVTVFGNQGIMEVDFDDAIRRTGVPFLYRSLLIEKAEATGGAAIFISGFDESPYLKGNLQGSALNSLVKITGYNSKRLTEIAEATLAAVERNRRVRNARITGSERFGRSTSEETVISIRREAVAERGLSVAEVVTFIRRLLGVDLPWTMLVDGEPERLRLQFAEADTLDFATVADEILKNDEGDPIRLGDLVSLETVPLSDVIERENQRYSMLVNWEYVGTNHMRRSYIQRVIDGMDLPYGYHAEESRQQFLTEEEESDLRLTVILAAVFILMVLMALFESLSLPLLVLTALPMAMLGVVVIYWKTTTAFDSSAQIGLVLLFGVVVNNAILLASRFRHEASLVLRGKLGGDPEARSGLFENTRRHLGGVDLLALPAAERRPLLRRAIARGTAIRLRSILLTSATTIVGLLPLLVQVEQLPSTWLGLDLPVTLRWLSDSEQDIWQNLALTSIGGLISSTVLILLVIPPLYYAGVQAGWLARRFYRWGSRVEIGRPGRASAHRAP